MDKPAVVIVPGAWHRPQHYQKVLDGLTASGYEAIGVALPSVDSNPPHLTWEEDALEIRRVIAKFLDAGKDVIAVGHSFGGISMPEAVKGLGKSSHEKEGRKGAVVRLVYMCAMACPKGMSYTSQVIPITPEEEEFDRKFKEMKFTRGGIIYDKDGSMRVDKEVVKETLYAGCDPQDAQMALDLCGSFPTAPLSVPVTYSAFLEIPSTYIKCKNDLAISVLFQERMIAQGEGVFDVEECDEGHSPFLSNPGFIVDCIRRAS